MTSKGVLDEQASRRECESLEKVLQALDRAVTDMTKHRAKVPPDIYVALRGARSLVNLCRSHPNLSRLAPGDIDAHEGYCVACCGGDIVARIRCELKNVEDLLVIKATSELGGDYATDIQKSLTKAWEPT